MMGLLACLSTSSYLSVSRTHDLGELLTTLEGGLRRGMGLFWLDTLKLQRRAHSHQIRDCGDDLKLLLRE
jgi:hypothetical protein